MEIAFREERIRFLTEKICDDISQEQTAEMTIPEDRPAISRIVDCFGTVTVQNRTAADGSVTVSGGIQAGVLYIPEGEEGPERVDVYLPFTVNKKLPVPEDTTVFYWGWLKSIDARFINSRKLLVRANLGSELTMLSPAELNLKQPEDGIPGLQCKQRTYRMLLPLYAAEKEIQIADEILMPDQEHGADRLLKWTCSAAVDESRVVGGKAVFKGSVRIRVLYASEDGCLSCWEGSVPYSQYAELGAEADDGVVTVQPIFRNIEIDTDGQIDSKRLLVNLTLTAQVLVRGEVPVTMTEDAYYLNGSFTPQWEVPDLSPCLDIVQQDLEFSSQLPDGKGRILDWSLFPDRVRRSQTDERGSTMDLRGSILYYDADEHLQSMQVKDSLQFGPIAAEEAEQRCLLIRPDPAQVNGTQLRLPVRTEVMFLQRAANRYLSGGTVQPQRQEEGATLIVKRASGDLWDLAKECKSTVSAMQLANELDCDTIPEERLVLIPVGRAVIGNGEDGV